jgi:hypothetical protein
MTDYRNGIPLAEAAFAFAPRSLVQEYDEARRLAGSPPKEFVPEGAPGDWAAGFSYFMEKVLAPLRAPIDIQVLMQEKLLTRSRKGKFIGLGFKQPRNPEDQPIQIPSDLFETRCVDWGNSAINDGAGLKFANVRMIKAPKKIPAIEHRSNPPVLSSRPGSAVAIPENRRKPGRPSKRSLIEEAYNALGAAVQANATKRAIAVAIQKWIEHYRPETAIPDDETIRRYIVKLQSSKLSSKL